MRNVIAVLCSMLVGCGVEEGIGAHAVWLNTPDGGDGCPIVCDPAGGFTADGCCEAADPPPAVITPTHVVLGPTTARPLYSYTVFNGSHWMLRRDSTAIFFPVSVPIDCAITQWAVHVTKGWGPSTLTAELMRTYYWSDTVIGAVTVIGNAGTMHLSPPMAPHTVESEHSYAIKVSRDNFYVSDDAIWYAETWHICPS
jgi:hypothetical protein